MEQKGDIMPRLEIETGDTIYEVEFGQVQIGITERCTMLCQHCRAGNRNARDLPVEQISKIMRFVRQFSPNHKEVIISGGEPLMHRDFVEVLGQVRKSGGDFVTLTTNGSLLTEEHLNLFQDLSFCRLVLSVSIDNLDPNKHDAFRRHRGAFIKAVSALRKIVEKGIPNTVVSMRSTIQSSQIPDMERMVVFAESLGCTRVSFSAIHPAGRAIERDDLWMTSQEKESFLREVYRLKKVFPHLNISTNDPLKCLLREENDEGRKDELVFDGCGAGVITFNVNPDGTMTPCALLNVPMMNILTMSVDQITEAYRKNPLVKNMLEMNLKGKCGSCQFKYQCGGCRARALIQQGDFLEEDPLEQNMIIIKNFEDVEEKMINFVKRVHDKIRDFKSHKQHINYINLYNSIDGLSTNF